MDSVAALLAQIHSAFPAAEPPQPHALISHDCEDCAALAAAFAGRTWGSVPDTVFDEKAESMPLFTTEAFAYYLPGFMCRAVAYPMGEEGWRASDVLRFTLYALCDREMYETPADVAAQWWSERMSPFEYRQRQAVAAFLTWVHATLDDDLCEDQRARALRGLAHWVEAP